MDFMVLTETLIELLENTVSDLSEGVPRQVGVQNFHDLILEVIWWLAELFLQRYEDVHSTWRLDGINRVYSKDGKVQAAVFM